MRTGIRPLLCLTIVFLLASTSLAQKRRRYHRPPVAWGVPEIFSNLSLEPETGDVGGMEVILFPGDGGLWATVMVASGAPSDPVLVRVNDEHYPEIEFTLPETPPSAGYGKITGRISRAGLLLHHGTERGELLRRQNSRQ